MEDIPCPVTSGVQGASFEDNVGQNMDKEHPKHGNSQSLHTVE